MLEQKIEQLTAAVNQLIQVMQAQSSAAPAPVAAPVVEPVAAPVVEPVAVAAPAVPAMPAPPVLETPVAAPPAAPVAVTNAAPFTDTSGMIQYVMSAYKALGATKGAEIQAVLTGLGYQNINEVKPEHYGALFAGIEALK
jgi:hypothetical protein